MNADKSKPIDQKNVAPRKKPDEQTGIYVSSHLKIFDPNTKEVLVQQRGD